MMLTARDAIMKVCPFMSGPVQRVEDTLLNAGDAYEGESDAGEHMFFAGCRASECMAWRFGKLPMTLATIPHVMTTEERLEIIKKDLPEPPRPENVPEDYIFMVSPGQACWVETMEGAIVRRKGYCGLVGLPEGTE